MFGNSRDFTVVCMNQTRLNFQNNENNSAILNHQNITERFTVILFALPNVSLLLKLLTTLVPLTVL